jgi:hypothetical protein
MYDWAKAITEVDHDEGAAIRVIPWKGSLLSDVKREAGAVALIRNAPVEFTFNTACYRIDPAWLLVGVSACGVAHV